MLRLCRNEEFMHFTKRIMAVLLVAALTAGLYAGSFIDWDSEDA